MSPAPAWPRMRAARCTASPRCRRRAVRTRRCGCRRGSQCPGPRRPAVKQLRLPTSGAVACRLLEPLTMESGFPRGEQGRPELKHMLLVAK
jgi:hypothetical protein